MPNHTEVPLVEKFFQAYLSASPSNDESAREPFLCGLQAGLWFFEVIAEQTKSPEEAVTAYKRFRKEVRAEFDKLNLPEIKPNTN